MATEKVEGEARQGGRKHALSGSLADMSWCPSSRKREARGVLNAEPLFSRITESVSSGPMAGKNLFERIIGAGSGPRFSTWQPGHRKKPMDEWPVEGTRSVNETAALAWSGLWHWDRVRVGHVSKA